MYEEYEKMMSIVKSFKGKRVMVIGDVMIDKYMWGNVTRISPEAPVQIVEVDKENFVPGGASNVANNISALGGVVYLIGVTGNDEGRARLLNELSQKGISTKSLLIDLNRPTIMKVRIMGGKQQLIRADYEKRESLCLSTLQAVTKEIEKYKDEVACIVVSDYAKGVISAELMEYIKQVSLEKKIPLVVDPKPKNKELYKGVTVITPNIKEVYDMLHMIPEEYKEEVKEAGMRLFKEMDSMLVVTRGEKGISIVSNECVKDIPARARDVFDVCGAGDTVAAAVSLSLCCGASMEEAAIIANHAAGIVVGKVGVATSSYEEVIKSLEDEEKSVMS